MALLQLDRVVVAIARRILSPAASHVPRELATVEAVYPLAGIGRMHARVRFRGVWRQAFS